MTPPAGAPAPSETVVLPRAVVEAIHRGTLTGEVFAAVRQALRSAPPAVAAVPAGRRAAA